MKPLPSSFSIPRSKFATDVITILHAARPWGNLADDYVTRILDECIAKIDALPDVKFGVWSPIATAPRGEKVLLYVANAFGHGHIKTGIAYPKNHPDLAIVSVFEDGEALGYLSEKYARYWMPLPPLPY